MKKIFLFLVIVTSAVISINAQSIQGRVVDQNTKNELLGAVVTIKGTTISAVTDINGFFSIKTNCTECKLIIEYYDYPKTELFVKKQAQQDFDMGVVSLFTSENKLMLKK